jgi:nucleoside-diphosphate-sugar epimerase
VHILVTGATGYIGRPTALALHADGHRVTGLTRDAWNARSTSLERAGITMTTGDMHDPAAYSAALTEADAVVHTVADADDMTGVDERLFAAVAAANEDGRARHLVYTTGCSTYGPSEHTVLTESTPVDPENRRARLEASLADTGLAWTVLRPGMVHGGDARSSIVGRWFGEAVDGRATHHGKPGKLWSWVHVEDVAAAYVAVLQEPAAHTGQVYLLADTDPVPPLEVHTAAARAAGFDGDVTFAPIADESPVYRGFDKDEVIDATKARTRLGWTPSRPDVLAALPLSFAEWSRAKA